MSALEHTIAWRLHFGPISYGYSLAFLVWLLIGWITVVLHANQSFAEPTYDVTQNEPASIMVPKFISSPSLYQRGFLFYVLSVTILYLILSLAGPAVVTPILNGFQNPQATAAAAGLGATPAADRQQPPIPATSESVVSEGTGSQEKQSVPSQWPLALALAIVGLAPNIPGLKEPERLLRRWSHKIALIPAYAKYIANQMAASPFDSSGVKDFRYPLIGVEYRPDSRLSKEPVDPLWLKMCVIFYRIKRLASGIEVPPSGQALDGDTRVLLGSGPITRIPESAEA